MRGKGQTGEKDEEDRGRRTHVDRGEEQRGGENFCLFLFLGTERNFAKIFALLNIILLIFGAFAKERNSNPAKFHNFERGEVSYARFHLLRNTFLVENLKSYTRYFSIHS